MARIVNIDRLLFCEGDAQSATPRGKGAGWVVRTSDLRVAASAAQARQIGHELETGLWHAIPAGVRVRIEREYRILRRKGIASLFHRTVGRLPRSLRSWA